ncbi:deoxyribonuclease II domain-containing protein [Phthorimaea operculella]|nr:deoxyribonuclease II domain-containing protein [Phthorimaea operculella]
MFYVLFVYLISLGNYCIGFSFNRNEGRSPHNVYCRDNFNEPVDWWYIYKPASDVAPYDDTGRNFSFIVSDLISRWLRPELPGQYITTTDNMLYHTLAPMYRSTTSHQLAVMVYDDAGSNQGAKARGILMVDQSGGIFISHTVPRLVDVNSKQPKFPTSELKYGHLLMCVSVDVDTINLIAKLVQYIGAKVTVEKVPEESSSTQFFPKWNDISAKEHEWLKKPFGPLEFSSRRYTLNVMVLFRRPGSSACLYQTFASSNGIVMDVYSPSGTNPKNTCSNNHGVRSIDSVSLIMWEELVHYIRNDTDKSRFAVSTAASWQRKGRIGAQYWTCTSGLDRADRSKKGGMLICVDRYEVWWAFDNLKVREPEC